MKKLLSILILFVMVLGLNAHEASARSNSRANKRTLKTQTVRKVKSVKKSNPYSALRYESVWYSRLSKKQKMTYLKTMETLILKISRSGVAGVESGFLNLFFPRLEADPRINNGFIFDGKNDDEDYDAFLETLEILGSPLDPRCSNDDQLCAPYMGMVCGGNPRGKLACSPDSTPTCAVRGNLECLYSSLESCGINKQGNSMSGGKKTGDPYCVKLDEMFRRGSEGVVTHCSTRGRASKDYCKDALASLQGEEVPASPELAEEPVNKACADLQNKIAQKVERGNKRWDEDKQKSDNNDFWRNLITFASQACGISSYNDALDRYGMCPEGTIGQPRVDALKRKAGRKTFRRDDPGYSSCYVQKSRALDKAYEDGVTRVVQQFANNETRRNQEIRKLGDEKSRKRSELINATECHMDNFEDVSADPGRPNIRTEFPISGIESLAAKIRGKYDLSREEENKFKAATGMSRDTFEKAFCNNRNYDSFAKVIKGAWRTHNRNIEGDPSINPAYDQDRLTREAQLTVAAHKLDSCVGRLKPNSGTHGSNCRMYTKNNHSALQYGHMLRCASSENPVVSFNKKTGECMAIYSASKEAGAVDNKTGQKSYRYTVKMETEATTDPEYPIPNFAKFVQEHDLRVYRCDGDREPSTDCYLDPGAGHEGEEAAREYYRNEAIEP